MFSKIVFRTRDHIFDDYQTALVVTNCKILQGMLEVRQLSFTYPNGKKLVFGDFAIARGQHSLLLGESGSGKTTLLHLLGGLIRNYSGLIKIDQTDLGSLSDAGMDRFRGQRIGFAFQRIHLINSLSVRQNLKLATFLAGNHPSNNHYDSILTKLGLSDKSDSAVTELSQGQAQRVAIARAVINGPALILADEPTSALDDRNCEEVVRLLMTAAEESGSTLLIATHDQRLKSRIENRISLK